MRIFLILVGAGLGFTAGSVFLPHGAVTSVSDGWFNLVWVSVFTIAFAIALPALYTRFKR